MTGSIIKIGGLRISLSIQVTAISWRASLDERIKNLDSYSEWDLNLTEASIMESSVGRHSQLVGWQHGLLKDFPKIGVR